MMKLLRAAFMAAFFACAALHPSGAMAQQFAAFAPSGQAALAATTSSARIALPTGDPTALVQNLGSVTVYLAFGRGPVSATTGGYPIQAGQSIAFAPGIYTHLAAITASGSATLSVTTGTGIPTLANAGGGGGGGGGGGAVTVADGADITQGAQGDAACATDNGACSIAALIKRANQRSTSLIAALGTPATAALQTTLNGYVDGIETQLTTIDGRVDGLEAQMTSALAKLDTVITNTDRSADVAESSTPTSVKFDGTTPGTTDGVTIKNTGVQGTGSTFDPPTGGSGFFGWLSGIYQTLKGTLTMKGSIAAGGTASDPPIMMGCLPNSTAPTSATGTVGYLSCTVNNFPRMKLAANASADLDTSAPGTTFSFGVSSLPARSTIYVLNAAGNGGIMPRVISGAAADGSDTLAVEKAGSPWIRISANAAVTNIKNTAGILHKVCINTLGASANLLSLYDTATTGTGTPIAVIDTTAASGLVCKDYDLRFGSGLAYALATGTAADITLVYR